MLSLICCPYFEELKDNPSYGPLSIVATSEPPQCRLYSLVRSETLGLTPVLDDNNFCDMITVVPIEGWPFLIIHTLAELLRMHRQLEVVHRIQCSPASFGRVKTINLLHSQIHLPIYPTTMQTPTNIRPISPIHVEQ